MSNNNNTQLGTQQQEPQQTGYTINALTALTQQLNLVDTGELYGIIRQTIMPSGATDEDLAAFCMVAAQYHLNPLVKEIHAFRTKSGGIMPMIGIDGWLKLVMSHADYNGMEHIYGKDEDGDVWVECRIFSKARPEHPTIAREFLSENKMATSPVWQQRPRRMLKHRATIQAVRYFAGICGFVDKDEAMDEAFSAPAEPRNVTPQKVSGKGAPTVARGTSLSLAAPAPEQQAAPLVLESPAPAEPVPARKAAAMPAARQKPATPHPTQAADAANDAPTPVDESALVWFNRSLQGSGSTWGKAYKALEAAGEFHPEPGASREVLARWCAELREDEQARKVLEESGIVFEK